MKDKQVILIVDDQPQNIELLEAYLAPQGYEIVTAANGEEALGKLSGNQIDLILLDIIMPGMDGFEVTRRIRQDNTHRLLPIIMVTVLQETEDRVKGIEAGCDDFISKPIDKSELLARVRSLLKVKAYNDLLSNYRNELESEVIERTGELKQALENLQQDITERRRAEEAMSQSEENFRIIFEQAADSIILLDVTPEGIPVIRDANRATFRLLGYERDELIGQPVSFIDSTFNVSEIFETQRTILSRTGIIFEARHRCKDGTIRDFECSVTEMKIGSKTLAVSVERDITERKKTQEALRESENKYRLVVDNMSDVIAVIDMNLRFTYVSPSVMHLRGYTVEEATAQTLEQVMTPESLQITAKVFEEEMKLEASGMTDPGRSRTRTSS